MSMPRIIHAGTNTVTFFEVVDDENVLERIEVKGHAGLLTEAAFVELFGKIQGHKYDLTVKVAETAAIRAGVIVEPGGDPMPEPVPDQGPEAAQG